MIYLQIMKKNNDIALMMTRKFCEYIFFLSILTDAYKKKANSFMMKLNSVTFADIILCMTEWVLINKTIRTHKLFT
jgi:hypothetical protein